jgi:hypothetical protein
MLNILNLGFGVQSTAVYLRSCLGELPKLDCCIAADTQWEPAAVYRHLQWLREEIAPKYRIPIHVVTIGNLREDMIGWKAHREAKARRARMPLFLLGPDGRRGMINRQCTSNYKIEPIERFIKTDILGLDVKARWPKEPVVCQWFGISADEFRRCSYPVTRKKNNVQIGTDLFGTPVIQEREETRPILWKSHFYPLCDRTFFNNGTNHASGLSPWDRQKCLDWMEAKGFPRPPRSACIGCPFHSDAEWKRLRSEEPAEFEDACDFDDSIRDYDQSNAGGVAFENLRGECFLHADRIPLRDVNFTDNDYPMFQCSDAVCGV